jgi:multimeric flavodoxin WrbA
MSDAVVRGISHPDICGIELKTVQPLQACADDVRWADAIVLGTTENFAYMSGAMKDFFDRIYYPCLEHTQGLAYALFIRAGNDGLGAKNSIQRIVTGLCWKQVQEPLICKGQWQDDFLDSCEELGLTVAAGLEAGIF